MLLNEGMAGHLAPERTKPRLKMAERRTRRTRRAGEPERTVPATVLVVDDDAAIRQVVCNMVRLDGYSVLAACSGEEALATAARHTGSIDLLLTDVSMPGIQGPELAERLVAARPDTRVLYMSGVTGSVGVGLVKPFTLQTLLSAVRAALAFDR